MVGFDDPPHDLEFDLVAGRGGSMARWTVGFSVALDFDGDCCLTFVEPECCPRVAFLYNLSNQGPDGGRQTLCVAHDLNVVGGSLCLERHPL